MGSNPPPQIWWKPEAQPVFRLILAFELNTQEQCAFVAGHRLDSAYASLMHVKIGREVQSLGPDRWSALGLVIGGGPLSGEIQSF